MIESDTEWGEPVWNDTAPDDPPMPTIDWRKSIPREFLAPTAKARDDSAARPGEPPARSWTGEPGDGTGLRSPDHGGGTGVGARETPPAPALRADDGRSGTAGVARHLVHEPRPIDTGPNGAVPPAGGSEGAPRADPPDGQPGGQSTGPGEVGPWNELDREIARALASALAAKLRRYVNGAILPLVADELVRIVGSGPTPDEAASAGDVPSPGTGDAGPGTSDGAEPRPRHFGDGPRSRG